MRINHEVCVGRFSVYGGGEATIVQSFDMAIQESDTFVFLVFDGKLNARVYLIKAGEVILYDLKASQWLATEDGENVVDIFFDEFWKAEVFFGWRVQMLFPVYVSSRSQRRWS